MAKAKGLLCISFLLWGTFLFAQNRSISGKVVSSKDNAGLAGVTISVKGTTTAVSTSADGSFTISVPSGKTTLTISSVGFAAKDMVVQGGDNNLVVRMDLDSQELGEVVVTALGIQRQSKTLVYATQSVKPSELTEVRDPNNVLNSLQGKVANAVVTQGSGGPGSGARIILRGNRSIQGSNNALIVVDGVPITNGTNGTAGSDFGFIQGSDGASNINPDDIESVTVLRGASAAALYGNQAGNGVIVITTKKGAKDKISVLLNLGAAVESAYSLPKVQNSYGQGNGGVLSGTSGESWGAKMTGQTFTNFLGQQSTYSPQPDNIKDFFRNGTSLNNSIGISGGTEKVQTYLSYTNNYIEGIVPKNNLMRNTVNLRISSQISSRFSVDGKVTYISQKIKNRPRTGEENAPTIDIYQIARNIPTSDANQYQTINNIGIPTPTPFPTTLSSIYQNPYWVINRTSINEDRDRIMGFVTAKFKLTNWLSISGRANLDRIFDRGDNEVSQGTVLWGKSGGDLQISNITTTSKWFDVMLEGNNSISTDWKVNYRVGAIYQDDKYDATFSSANGLNITNKFSMDFAKAPGVDAANSEVQVQSVYGQVNFSFKDAIFLDASLRNDWDSRLPEPHTFQYPSVGVSALLSELMKLPTSISFLKASVNYAEVGNGGIFGLTNPAYIYSQGAGNGFLQRSATLPIPGLKPEIVKNWEFGLETKFIDNRIGFSATFYKSNSFNQLMKVNLPVASGYANKYINAGNIQNKGLEFVVSAKPISGKDLNWDIAFNFGLNRSKVIELSDEIKIFYLGGGFGRSATPVVEEGKAYGDLLAFKWQVDAKGNRVVTAAGKPVLTQEQEFIGNYYPKENLGLTNTFTYKRFSLRVLIDGRIGGTVVSGTEMNLAFSGIPEVTEQYREGNWSLGGVDANGAPVTKPITSQDFWQIASGKRYGAGEFFAYDATSFRVRELTVGYDIPLKSTGFASFVKGLRIAFVSRNLFFIYRGSSIMDIPGVGKRKMWFDPDMSLGNGNWQGVEYGTLPATRSVGLNLRVTL
jgi:TonB-linked SusC/RagA family outer membrane protein